MYNILVVDDEESIRSACQQILSAAGYNVTVAENGLIGLAAAQKEAFDIAILDLNMPGMNGMDLLKKIKEDNPLTIVIIITGYATIESSVEAMRAGAYDFIPKPFTPIELKLMVERSLEKKALMAENESLHQELKDKVGDDLIIGQSEEMKKVHNLILKVGPTDSTVLITGESGTGKELIARAICQYSLRRDKPFVVTDCGALVENLFESELFGHVKGAFTGASSTKHGRFELANNGTLFFDEIGNISLNVQAKLLRAIQEREITKVGGTQVTKIDVRIIAATNKDLSQAVRDGTFRDDLFYRLSVVPIYLPPLRQRKENIKLLASYFLEKFNKQRKKEIRTISAEAMDILANYHWPGNVRELENTIERAVVLTEGDIIQANDLVHLCNANRTLPTQNKKLGHLAEVEKEHIMQVLKMLNDNKTKTAQFLGIDRKTLQRKMTKYGLFDSKD
ncbi:MAG TPA: sigma-54 dependent transcriptional regulator [Planctomycetota bacterium]|nr:sigma-54 dependent transcriptional regulator [Planctomycetota bacterium]